MIYVYDVLVNFNEEMYDFYDWDENDDLIHIRRVPIYKVKSDVFYDIYSKNVKLSESFIENIKDKTQVFSSRNIEIIPYSSIFSDGKSAVIVQFDSNGVSKKKSKFLVNEEMEILDITVSMKVSDLDYNVVSERIVKNKMLRSERKIINDILYELEFLKDDSDRIDYLYYEWFESQDGINKYDRLIKDIKKSFTSKHNDFLELLNLLTIKK